MISVILSVVIKSVIMLNVDIISVILSVVIKNIITLGDDMISVIVLIVVAPLQPTSPYLLKIVPRKREMQHNLIFQGQRVISSADISSTSHFVNQ
jgi:hypothetical protein